MMRGTQAPDVRRPLEYRFLAARALRLAVGRPRDADALTPSRTEPTTWWQQLLTVAAAERLATLAWHRCDEWLGRHAPAEVLERWRRQYRASCLREMQLAETGITLAGQLAAAGFDVVWLKGAPLARRLHGDPYVRPSTDLDFHVPAAQRSAVHEQLRDLAWERIVDAPGGDTTWRLRDTPTGDAFLEIHHRLAGWRTPHLSFPPPTAAPVMLGDAVIVAHDGPELPAYLAVHCAKHRIAPLGWWIDLDRCWRALDDSGRAAARAAAGRAGARSYLEWAIGRLDALSRAAGGDDHALARLDIGAAAHRGIAPVWRHAALAGGLASRLRALGPWIWDSGRSEPAGRVIARRIRRLRDLLPDGRVPPPMAGGPERAAGHSPVRQLAVDRSDLRAAAELARAAQTPFWVVVHGSSMWPAIPPHAAVRLAPAGTVAVGDIALAFSEDDSPVLHRVVGVGAGTVQMRGDNALQADRPFAREAVVARADAVSIGGVVVPLDRRPKRTPRSVVSWWTRRLRLAIGRPGVA